MNKPSNLIFYVVALTLIYTTVNPVYSQVRMGTIIDQARQQTFSLFSDLMVIDNANPANRGFAFLDPSGMNFLMLSSTTPHDNAFFIDWNMNLVEVNRLTGIRIVGQCHCVLPVNPFIVHFQPPNLNGSIGIPFNNSILPIATQLVDPEKPFGKILITDEMHASKCFSHATKGDGSLDRELFGKCMVNDMISDKDREILECIRTAKTSDERALCLFGTLGGKREKEIAAQLQQCYAQYGSDFSRYPLCMAGTVVKDDKLQRVISCMDQQVKSTGKVTFSGVAICYGAQQFELNAETQIILECAVATGGDPYAFAGCAGGQLLSRELNKCLTDGVGGDGGCFGKNNEIVKALNNTGELIKLQYGVGSPQLKAWQKALEDLTQGPGKKNLAVQTFTNLSNEVGRGIDNVGKEVSKHVPRITL